MRSAINDVSNFSMLDKARMGTRKDIWYPYQINTHVKTLFSFHNYIFTRFFFNKEDPSLKSHIIYVLTWQKRRLQLQKQFHTIFIHSVRQIMWWKIAIGPFFLSRLTLTSILYWINHSFFHEVHKYYSFLTLLSRHNNLYWNKSFIFSWSM